MSNIADNCPIKVVAKNDEERYIIEEAKKFLNETAFLSNYWSNDKHIKNVIDLGRKNIDFLMEMMKENDKSDGMYAHFLLYVVFGLYGEELNRDVKVEGYI